MTFAFRLKLLAGVTATTLCLAPITSNQATAQIFLQRSTVYHNPYNPYGSGFRGGYDTRYYGGRFYGDSRYGLSGVYARPSVTVSRYGVYYRGGLQPQFPTFGSPFYRSVPRYYSPFGYGRRW